jgi:hypothetical protein
MTIDTKTENFILRAKEKHGDKYDYSKVVYTRAQEKVLIICKKHNLEFLQVADSHVRLGMGCKVCGYESNKTNNLNIKKTTEQFISESKAIHGESTYDYSKTVYSGKASKLILTCKVHNTDFEVIPNNHISAKSGCKLCGIEKAHTPFKKLASTFIEDSMRLHGDSFDYSKVDYKSNKDKVTLICKKAGHIFDIRPDGHLSRGDGCPHCSGSNQEDSFKEFILSIYPSARFNDRTIIKPLELDVVLDDIKIAFEYNGLYWHSEAQGKGKNYHIGKTISCNKSGYRLIHVLEDEWLYKTDIVKSRISHILGVSGTKYHARKLSIRQVSFGESETFFNNNHIQGSPSYLKYGYGLFNGSDMVACMSFCTPRFNCVEDKNDYTIELLRYASSGAVVGGFSRLLKHFTKEHANYTRVVSFSDKRWSEGGVYSTNGFSYEYTDRPGYDYIDSTGHRLGRHNYMKHKLPKLFKNFDPLLSEWENCRNNRVYRIWNCGMDKWALNMPTATIA